MRENEEDVLSFGLEVDVESRGKEYMLRVEWEV